MTATPLSARRPVVGIDPSLTATGVCWPDGTTEVITWPGRGVDRLAEVAWWVETTFAHRSHDPAVERRRQVLVAIEGYSMGSARQQSHAHGLGELGGVLRLSLRREGFSFIDVPPATVKKYATGKGNANKDLVRDAAWLRQIGLRLLDDPAAVDVPKLHLSALDKLDVPTIGAAA